MEDTAPKQALNISQAFNYLSSLKDKLVGKMKRAVKDAQISVAPPRDRRNFIAYGVSLLQKVDSDDADLFYKVTGKSPNLYSNTELAEMFRKLLLLRANQYSIKQIAYVLKSQPEVLEKVELIAVEACKKAIERAKVGAVPLLGGLN